MNEYNTVDFDTPVMANYFYYPQSNSLATASQDNTSVLQSIPVTSLSLGKNNEYTARIAKAGDRVFIEGIDVPIDEAGWLEEYVAWSRGLTTELSQAGMSEAEVTITFNQHIAPLDFEQLITDYQLDVSKLHVEYVGVNDQGASEVWSGFIRNHHGIDMALLDETAREQTSVDLTQPHGVVAVHSTMPIEQVNRLNQDNRVFLADPIVSYIEFAASQNADVQTALADALIQRKENMRRQAEISAQQGDQQAQTLLASSDIDQELDALLVRNPELRPRITTKIRDFWHLINQ
jgi:hypothetical protein